MESHQTKNDVSSDVENESGCAKRYYIPCGILNCMFSMVRILINCTEMTCYKCYVFCYCQWQCVLDCFV